MAGMGVAVPYRVISTVAQRNGEIYSGMIAVLMFGEGPEGLIDGVYARIIVRDTAACKRLDEISPLQAGYADLPVEMTMTAFLGMNRM